MRVTLEDVAFAYGAAAPGLFRGISGAFESGEMVAVTGPSGSGKSTMLDLLGGVRQPTRGLVTLFTRHGRECERDEHTRACSWVLQSNFLLSRRSVLDNVAIGAYIRGIPSTSAIRTALAALDRVGLQDHARSTVNSLSGGERQRVTVARCLASPAQVVLADEPTGNLDAENTARVTQCLRRTADSGKLVFVATHDQSVASACDRLLSLGGEPAG